MINNTVLYYTEVWASLEPYTAARRGRRRCKWYVWMEP